MHDHILSYYCKTTSAWMELECIFMQIPGPGLDEVNQNLSLKLPLCIYIYMSNVNTPFEQTMDLGLTFPNFIRACPKLNSHLPSGPGWRDNTLKGLKCYSTLLDNSSVELYLSSWVQSQDPAPSRSNEICVEFSRINRMFN